MEAGLGGEEDGVPGPAISREIWLKLPPEQVQASEQYNTSGKRILETQRGRQRDWQINT